MPRARVTAVQQHEVDQPAMLVDGAEQVLPLSTDLKRVMLDLPEDCRGVDLHSALLHHLCEIAICDAVLAIPPHAYQDDRPEIGGA